MNCKFIQAIAETKCMRAFSMCRIHWVSPEGTRKPSETLAQAYVSDNVEHLFVNL